MCFSALAGISRRETRAWEGNQSCPQGFERERESSLFVELSIARVGFAFARTEVITQFVFFSFFL